MRLDNYEVTYQDYKDSVKDTFDLINSKGLNWTPKTCTDFIVDEFAEDMESTCLAMWMIAIGTREIELNILEKRVHNQLCGHIPKFQRGEYDDELSDEEKELISKDVEYILQNVEMYTVRKVPDDEYDESGEYGEE